MEPPRPSKAAYYDEPKDEKRRKLPEAADYDEPKVKKGKKLRPRNVCIICSCASLETNDDYHIFIVDLNSGGKTAADELIPRAPTLRLDAECFDASAVCVLGSMLYMFESSDQRNTSNLAQERKSVYTFDLSKIDLSTTFNLKLEKHMLDKAPDMLSAKSSPVATPTRDGKILVFSSQLKFDPRAKTADTIDFELYEPDRRSWRALPGICDNLRNEIKYCIAFSTEAFTVLKNSVVLLQTDWIGTFALNLESPDKGWKRLDRYVGFERIPFRKGRFFVIGNEDLYVTPDAAYDLKREDGFIRLFSSFEPPFDQNYDSIDLAVTPLDGDGDGDVVNGRHSYCWIQTGINGDTLYPYLLMDERICDVSTYKHHKEKIGDFARLSQRIVNSFKFLLDTQQCGMICPVYVCSI